MKPMVSLLLGALFVAAAVGLWLRTHAGTQPTTMHAVAQPGSLSDAATAPAPAKPTADRGAALERSAADTARANDESRWYAHGIVVDEDKQPIEGIDVQIWWLMGEWNQTAPELLGVARSGPEGRFAFSLEALRSLSQAAQQESCVHARSDGIGWSPSDHEVYLRDIILGHPDGTIRLHMSKESLVKGRVVDAAGRPIAGATVAVLCESTEQCTSELDGSFYFWPDPRQRGAATAIAAHGKHGRSSPVPVTILEGQETRIPDLIIASPGNCIRGRVLLPDSSPAADVDIEWTHRELSENELVATGSASVSAAQYQEFVLDDTRMTTSDEQGRFVFCGLLQTQYTVSAFGDVETTVQFDARTTEQSVILQLSNEDTGAQILVHIRDEHGVLLGDAEYGVHLWHGPRAAPAQLRYTRTGATPGLLRTADNHDLGMEGNDTVYQTETDTFAVFEACGSGRGPVYASCRLLPNVFRGSVEMVLAPASSAGALQLCVQVPNGRHNGPVWIRMCRGPTKFATPLSIPDAARCLSPKSNIRGPWFEVPDNGIVHGLPTGQLTIEVLPHSVDGDERTFEYAFARTSAIVSAAATEAVHVHAAHGAHLSLEIVPPIVEGTKATLNNLKVNMTALGGGRRNQIELEGAGSGRTGPWQASAEGRGIERSKYPLAEGSYKLTCSANIIARYWSEARDGKPGQWVNGYWRTIDLTKTVRLRRGQAPIVLDLQSAIKDK